MAKTKEKTFLVWGVFFVVERSVLSPEPGKIKIKNKNRKDNLENPTAAR